MHESLNDSKVEINNLKSAVFGHQIIRLCFKIKMETKKTNYPAKFRVKKAIIYSVGKDRYLIND